MHANKKNIIYHDYLTEPSDIVKNVAGMQGSSKSSPIRKRKPN